MQKYYICSMKLKFWKYEGAGNDFVMIDGRGSDYGLTSDLVCHLCDRHRGIGADGLIVLLDQHGYDFRMCYFNADGGEVDMCGNGGRCITLFADDLGIGGNSKRFLGRDGVHEATVISRSGYGAQIRLGMIDVDGFERIGDAFFLNTGVPHYVEFVDNVDLFDVPTLGREKRYDKHFEAHGGTNVNFVEMQAGGSLKIRTYERGVEGETLACGTGATAAAIAARLFACTEQCRFTVQTRGGILSVDFETTDNRRFTNVQLSGSANRVFCGEIKF
jgi:diaminopimelate epimerase